MLEELNRARDIAHRELRLSEQVSAYISAVNASGSMTPEMYRLGLSLNFLKGCEMISYESLSGDLHEATEGLGETISNGLGRLGSVISNVLNRFRKKAEDVSKEAQAKKKSGFLGFGKPKKRPLVDVTTAKALFQQTQTALNVLDFAISGVSSPDKFKTSKDTDAYISQIKTLVDKIQWPWGKIETSITDKGVFDFTLNPTKGFSHPTIVKMLTVGTLEEHGWSKTTASSAFDQLINVYRAADGILADYDTKVLPRFKSVQKDESYKEYVRAATSCHMACTLAFYGPILLSLYLLNDVVKAC